MLLMFLGCSSHHDDKNKVEYWKSRGNGFVLAVEDDKSYKWYEVTSMSRFLVGEGTIEDDVLYYYGAKVSDLDWVLDMCDQIDAIPEAQITEATDDPEINFEIFWTTFDQYYSFFDLMTGKTWQSVYDEYRPKVTQTTTQEELWDIFTEMIKPLNDGHTLLLDFNNLKQEESRPQASSPSYWMMENRDAYVSSIESYMNSFSAEKNIVGNGNILYGTIGQDIGYMNIFAFDGYSKANNDLNPFTILSTLSVYSNDIDYFPGIIDQIFTEFKDKSALIIDLRFNTGGSGDLVLELTDRLVKERKLAYTYQVRLEGRDEFDKSMDEYVEPKGVQFIDKPIIVLVSNNTISAGDLQTMLLKDLPNVTVIGETTFGIFSEAVPRQLPNGWNFTLSTQKILSPDGISYEQKGITPDVEVTPDMTLLGEGRDNMLESAMSELD
jgi:carboxyl-terminal processing protease